MQQPARMLTITVQKKVTVTPATTGCVQSAPTHQEIYA